jgi:hypothetical protein
VGPFRNASEYKGKWNIGPGIAGLLLKKLQNEGLTNAELNTQLFSSSNTRKISVSGLITKFKFHEYIAAAYRLGGYKNYVVDIIIKLKLVSKSPGGLKADKDIECSISNKKYGLTVFGGPGQSDDFDVNVYEELQKIPFASDEYWTTIYGTATKECVNKMSEWIIERLSESK